MSTATGPASWLAEFWDQHRRRAGRHPDDTSPAKAWTALSPDEADLWVAALGHADADLELALEASRRALTADRTRRRDTQVNLILVALEELRAERSGSGNGNGHGDPGSADVVPSTIEEARKLSRGCPECGGAGLAVRYVARIRTHDGHDLGDPGGPPEVPATFVCTCPLGRAIRAGKWPEHRCPFPDLAERKELHCAAVDWSDRPDTESRYPNHDVEHLRSGWRDHVRQSRNRGRNFAESG